MNREIIKQALKEMIKEGEIELSVQSYYMYDLTLSVSIDGETVTQVDVNIEHE